MQTACYWQFCFSDRLTGARNPARLRIAIQSRRIRCSPYRTADRTPLSVGWDPFLLRGPIIRNCYSGFRVSRFWLALHPALRTWGLLPIVFRLLLKGRCFPARILTSFLKLSKLFLEAWLFSLLGQVPRIHASVLSAADLPTTPPTRLHLNPITG
jgi:hypothetical protein